MSVIANVLCYVRQMNLFSRFPGVSCNSHGNKMPSKWACWTPVTNIKLCNKQRASLSSQGDAFNQGEAYSWPLNNTGLNCMGLLTC